MEPDANMARGCARVRENERELRKGVGTSKKVIMELTSVLLSDIGGDEHITLDLR